jgi:hypothetical protein
MHKITGIDGRDLTIVKVLPPILPDDPTCEERIMILTGKRTRPDVLRWHAGDRLGERDYAVRCQGLYRGHYGDANVKASDLYAFMVENAPREALHFKRALDAWLS